MDQFAKFVTKLLDKPNTKTHLSINGKSKTVKGMACFASLNAPESEYIKIVFTDGSFLLVLLGDKLLYYADSIVGHIKSIKDTSIGKEKTLNYRDQVFTLVNANDYQYVIERYVGKLGDVEGECSFSDYVSKSGSMLSLGRLSINQERADIYCEPIDMSQVTL